MLHNLFNFKNKFTLLVYIIRSFHLPSLETQSVPNTGGYLKCPKKYVEDVFCTWWHMQKFLKCPKIEPIHFRFFPCFTVVFLEIWCSKILKCPIFPIFRIRWEKWGISGKTNRKKWGISRKKHVIDLKTRKEPKINMFDFGAFQEKLHMLSREKYLLHMLFGAFHDTPCSIFITSSLRLGISRTTGPRCWIFTKIGWNLKFWVKFWVSK